MSTSETRKASFESVDKQKRYAQIIEILHEKGALTAKEIAVMMYEKGFTPTTERNFSAPRITELMKDGILVCVGTKRCQYTNKTVSIFNLA